MSRTNLGILCSQFPEMHETFVIRELRTLQEAGIPLRIYSMKNCRDKVIHAESKPLLGQTFYLTAEILPLVWKFSCELFFHPIRAIWTLIWALRLHFWPIPNFAKAVVTWALALAATYQMRRDGITHLHAHWANWPTNAAVTAAKMMGIPFSFTAHAFDIFVRNPSLEEKIKRSCGVITCTDYNRNYLVRLVPEAAAKIFLNYHGVTLEMFSSQPETNLDARSQNNVTPKVNWTIGMPDSRQWPLFLTIGRLVETKGYPVLLQAYAKLRERKADFRAILVGTGPLKTVVEKQILDLKLQDRVELKPSCDQEILLKLYRKAYAFVLPCVIAKNGDRDGIPNVILEAMAAGLPVVSTNISGIPEAVQDQKTGLLLSPEDPEQLVNALDFLLRNPDFAQAFGDRGRKYVEIHFSSEKHMQLLIDGMKTIIGGKKVKVAHIIWSFEIGGAERAVWAIAQSLDPRKFESIVICLNQEGRLAQSLKEKGIRVFALNKQSAFDLAMLAKLTSLLRQENVDLVHCHLFGANLWGRLAGIMAGVPIRIAHEHGMQPWRSAKHFLIDRLLAPMTACILFVSEEVRGIYLERTGISQRKCRLIRNGVHCPEITGTKAEIRKQLGLNPDAQIIISVGRLSSEKGHEDLLKAFIDLAPKFPNAHLVLVGDGPERNHLEHLSKEHGLNGKLVFAGNQDTVGPWLEASDIYVQPSRREALSFAVLEAMAAGLPVIATRVGDVEKVITDGKEGYLTVAGSPSELVQKIGWVLTHLQEQRVVTEAARRVIQNQYSYSAMISAIEAVYEEALSNRRIERGTRP